MKISAVIIGQNEQALLPRCLESLKGIDEIVFCDQGSMDNTIEVAKRYTDKIFTDHKWNDSFCSARNHAKAHATGDWILSIDCDEILHDVGAVKEAVVLGEQRNAFAIDVKMIAEDNGQFFYFPRLFKNSPQVWWMGNIHNTLSVVGETVGNVRITHGYSPAHDNDPNRAFRILKKDVEAGVGGARELYYLGREYYYRKQYEDCVVTLGKYVQQTGYLAEKADGFLLMARAYWAMKMPNDARDACAQALIINANFKEAIAFMAILSGEGTRNEKWEANARQWRRMAETADNRDVLFVRPV